MLKTAMTSQVLASTPKSLSSAPAWTKRRVAHMKRILKNSSGKTHRSDIVFAVIKLLGNDADTYAIIRASKKFFGVTFTPTQVYMAAYYLRKTGKLEQYKHSYKKAKGVK